MQDYEVKEGLVEPSPNPFYDKVLRHSCAHVLAKAVLKLFPGTKLGIGPDIENGFYYDFKLPDNKTFTEEDLARIEEEMSKIIARDEPFKKVSISFEKAKELFADQNFKLEIINSLRANEIVPEMEVDVGDNPDDLTVYYTGDDFFDLCRGPHVVSTSYLANFKLLRQAGAYWKANEQNAQLQRIYGTVFRTKEQLEEYLFNLEEAKKRDHRRLGLELDWFLFPKEIGGGLALFSPKGALIRIELENFSRDTHLRNGYQPVWTPHITKEELFQTSGHLSFFKEGMFPAMELDGANYYIKPMSCPFHVLIYASRLRSYRELPLRLFELATVYRNERSGVLHGLSRLRALTQDDAHIFVAQDKLHQELEAVVEFMLKVLKTFGLNDFKAELSTRPEKFVGEVADWNQAQDALKNALKVAKIDFEIAEGQGAFYAPKIDIHLKDALKRTWQCSTIQVDFQEPKRFGLSYISEENKKEKPFMIHRALFGSVERFLSILIEHFAGNLPTWLCPVQVAILPVNKDVDLYAEKVQQALIAKSVRANIIPATTSLSPRIKMAKLEKIPYIAVVGSKDVNENTVGINVRGTQREVRGVSLDSFLEEVHKDIIEKRVNPFSF